MTISSVLSSVGGVLRNAGLVLVPLGLFLSTYQLRERCFTQMHSRRESAYRRFERPFAEWCVENSWIVHMNYPRFVIPLSMAEQMHLLFDQQEHAIKELITAEASKERNEDVIATLQADLDLYEREMLLLDTIRREARRYVKSEAMFEEPNFLDLLMLNSAEVNLHDLEEEACEHLSSCFFVACALDAAEAAFLEDYLFLLHENQNFHTLRNGNTKKNMEEYFNARSVGMWRRIFEKNVEHGRE